MSTKNSEEFSIKVDVGESAIVAIFAGNADLLALESLEKQLPSLHESAARQGVPLVRVDFRELEFMNSSCFKCFISWLTKVQELPDAERYRIVFVSNRQMHWQRRSLEPLRSFAPDVVSIEVHG